MTWKFITSKRYQVLSRYWVLTSFRDTMKELLGIGLREYKIIDDRTYIKEEELDALSKFLIKEFEKDKNYLIKFSIDGIIIARD